VDLPGQGLTLTVEVTDGRRVGKVLAVRNQAGGKVDEDGSGGESTKGADR
jgi:hypothetical protein